MDGLMRVLGFARVDDQRDVMAWERGPFYVQLQRDLVFAWVIAWCYLAIRLATAAWPDLDVLGMVDAQETTFTILLALPAIVSVGVIVSCADMALNGIGPERRVGRAWVGLIEGSVVVATAAGAALHLAFG